METSRSRWKVIFALIPLLSVIGYGFADSRYCLREYKLGRLKEATVGSLMMAWEYGTQNDFYGNNRSAVREELYYSGIAQNIVYINYRRQALYSNGNVGQPFDQEFKYDISNSRLVTIEDVIIQVTNADQQKIRYTIVKGPTADGLQR